MRTKDVDVLILITLEGQLKRCLVELFLFEEEPEQKFQTELFWDYEDL